MRRLTILLFAVALTSGLGAPWAGATSSSTLLSLLVQKGEMAGFAINGTPTAGATPTSFVKNIYKVTGSTEKNDVATLVGEGFIGGASEFLRASDGLAASQVWEFEDRDGRQCLPRVHVRTGRGPAAQGFDGQRPQGRSERRPRVLGPLGPRHRE